MICDCIDERNCFIHYKTLKFYVRQEMIVDKIQETTYFKQSKWPEIIQTVQHKKEMKQQTFLKTTSLDY